MSLNRVTDGDHEDQLAFELPRARAAWPAWALVAALMIMGIAQLARGAPSDIEGVRGLALSASGLARGEWWTILTQMLVQENFFAQVVAIGAVVAMGVATLGARDPRWMGGWRTLAVYAACGLAAALVHLFSESSLTLTGVWPALLGLAAFYWLSGRSAGLQRPPGQDAETPPAISRNARGWEAASRWAFLCLLTSATGLLDQTWLPFAFHISWELGAVIVIGGVVIAYLCEGWAPRPIRWAFFTVSSIAYGLVAVLYVSTQLRQQAIPWEALTAGAMTGAVLGLAELGWRRDRRNASAA